MGMKTGKVSEAILVRSIFKQIKHRRDEVFAGPGIGQDCAAISIAPDEVAVLSADPITGTIKEIGRRGIVVSVNNLAASGAEPIGVLVNLLLPEKTSEEKMRKLMSSIEDACRELCIQVLGGHTEVTKAVCQPVVTVTSVGKVAKDQFLKVAQVHPGQDLVVTKWIGLEGTSVLAKEHEEDLKKRFPAILVDTGKEFETLLSVLQEASIAKTHGITAMHDVSEGGIFGALWEMASGAGVGLEVDLRKIPIRQETVEICEFVGVNPYQLLSGGSLLIATENGHELVRCLEQEGIKATVVGRTTDGKDRIIRNGAEVRYLDKPQQDEIYRIGKE